MRFVLLTYDGVGLPVALKLKQEGYDVIVGQIKKLDFLKEEEELDKRRLSLYNGIIEKYDADELVNSLLKEKNKEDYFIFSDFNFVYPYATKLKSAGFRGLLPSEEDYKLEHDRDLAKKIIKKHYPIFEKEESYDFYTIKDAFEFLDTRKDKIWGVKGFNVLSQTFFPHTNIIKIAHEELKDKLEAGKELYEKDGFILEEKIEDLIEFTPEIITFDEKILGINVDIELKHFGPANTSFLTGDSASLIFWAKENHWYKFIDLFFPLEDLYLRKNEMVLWDASVFFSPSRNSFYFGEFCSNREGYNSLFNKLSTMPYVGNYFEKIINKQEIYDDDVLPFGTSIRIFNEIRDSNFRHLIVAGSFVHADLFNKNVWLLDVYQKNNRLYTAGYDDNLAVITYPDTDWKRAFSIIHDKIKEGKIFNYSLGYYRSSDDILSENYWGNITQRYNWVIENILKEDYNENKDPQEIIRNILMKKGQ